MRTAADGTEMGAMIPAAAGFLLAEPSLKPMYANAEAIQVLTYPEDPSKLPSLDNILVEKIPALFPDHPSKSPSALVAEFMSGRRRYRCRVFALTSRAGNGFPQPAVALLIERSGQASFDVTQSAAQFHLTPREQETLLFLIQGLTNKEIAERMNISPNTVKAFLKLMMVKMGVSTRSGIIGKVMHLHI